jgi:hypothetical protein
LWALKKTVDDTSKETAPGLPEGPVITEILGIRRSGFFD